jgi:carboxymethylenebutenolidase
MPDPDFPPSPDGVPGALTDTSRVSVQEILYAGADGEMINGYVAAPSEGGRHPGLIVIHEAGGLGDHIKDVTRRFANVGYLALGVDLYTREGGPPPAGDMQALFKRLFAMPDDRVLADLEGVADLLRGRPDCTGKVGCIGFCMGGRFTLLFACASDRLDAAIDCWGGFIDSATPQERSTPQRPTPPLELVGKLHCPLMAAIGAEDHNPSPEIGEKLAAALSQTPYETVVNVYEGAGHAFFADYRPTYRPQAAALLWERALPFLTRHLQGPG